MCKRLRRVDVPARHRRGLPRLGGLQGPRPGHGRQGAAASRCRPAPTTPPCRTCGTSCSGSSSPRTGPPSTPVAWLGDRGLLVHVPHRRRRLRDRRRRRPRPRHRHAAVPARREGPAAVHRALPDGAPVALAPLVVGWGGQLSMFGLDWQPWMSVAVIAAYLAFFPVAVGALQGLQSPSPESVELMDSYAARGGRRWSSCASPPRCPTSCRR